MRKYKIIKILDEQIYQQVWSSFDLKLSQNENDKKLEILDNVTTINKGLEGVTLTPIYLNNQIETSVTGLNLDTETNTDDENDDILSNLNKCEFTFIDENEPPPILPDGFFDDELFTRSPSENLDTSSKKVEDVSTTKN